MQYISHGAYLSTCACVAWTRTPTTRGRPNCFVLDMPLCWHMPLYSNMFRLRRSRVARIPEQKYVRALLENLHEMSEDGDVVIHWDAIRQRS
jgi:hypothetical protein